MTAPIRNARTCLNLRLSESILLTTPCPNSRIMLTNCFDSGSASADAIAQFGQEAIITTPLNLNFTKTISNELRQYGQLSPAWSALMNALQTGRPNRFVVSLTFSVANLCWPVCEIVNFVRGSVM